MEHEPLHVGEAGERVGRTAGHEISPRQTNNRVRTPEPSDCRSLKAAAGLGRISGIHQQA